MFTCYHVCVFTSKTVLAQWHASGLTDLKADECYGSSVLTHLHVSGTDDSGGITIALRTFISGKLK